MEFRTMTRPLTLMVLMLLAIPTMLWAQSGVNTRFNWSQSVVDVTASRGTTTARTLTLSSSAVVFGAVLEVVPELAPFVTLEPSAIFFISPAQSVEVRLTFRIPQTAALGDYAGTIHVRSQARTVPTTLKIHLNVVDPSGLPPDPGDSGKATLGGVDADSDGVRDDLQRYIAFTYSNSKRVQLAVTDLSKAFQRAVVDATDATASHDHAGPVLAALACLYYIDPVSTKTIKDRLIAHVLNTKPRSEAYILFNAQLGGKTFHMPAPAQLKSACSFDPDNILP
jgi:hypothetical protein